MMMFAKTQRACFRISILIAALLLIPSFKAFSQTKIRARDLGIPFSGTPGAYNAITDVPGILVGHTTIISGEGQLVVGEGPVRTGVTAILPKGKTFDPVFAAWNSLNGAGEMTGTQLIDEWGFLATPILITNSSSVGAVRDAVIDWQKENKLYHPFFADYWASLPLVTETYDGVLNDIHGFHVKPQHVFDALNNAASGPVEEGNTGGGTGMMCYQFKGGIGTSSRTLEAAINGVTYTVGALVQANHGKRSQLTISGVPAGREITGLMPEINADYNPGTGSIIAVIATNAPLLPIQLKRVALRAALGIARTGGIGENSSGEIFLAFSTANAGAVKPSPVMTLQALNNGWLDMIFQAAVQSVEEAIVNALVAAETMTGVNGNTVHALPHGQLIEAMKKYNRWTEPDTNTPNWINH